MMQTLYKVIFKPAFYFLFLLLFFCTSMVHAQMATLQGVVKDDISGETLIQASVKVGSQGTTSDLDGKYRLELPVGQHEVQVSYIGYKTQTITLDIPSGQTVMDFNLQEDNILVQEIEVVADVARSRKTPIAFSTVSLAKIEEEVSVQDLPMVLNSTPGVYATQQGGGDGDARITIRGFNQRNIAIMIDGIPVNDMENGWVYWSNWSGLSNVARSMQVQRGLGASKLALPSIGGTINLLTKGIESKRRFAVKQQFGNNNFMQTTLSGTTGRLNNGWGITFTGSYRQRDGWVDNTWSKAWFYFLKVEKELGKHTLGFSVVGAPQEHAQRSFKEKIKVYSSDFARDLFQGTDDQYAYLLENNTALKGISNQFRLGLIDQAAYDQALSDIGASQEILDLQTYFVDTTNAQNYGFRYNRHWGYQGEEGNLEAVTERKNFYHKPQVTLKDFWVVNDKLSISNIAYLSAGDGGGTANSSSSFPRDPATGLYNYQVILNGNSQPLFPGFPPPAYSSNIMRASVNNHIWYGLLSTFDYAANDQWEVSGGIDLRHYTGTHYRKVSDLLGGPAYAEFSNVNESPQTEKQVDDIIEYHYDGVINWGGLFAQAEYSTPKVTAFANVTTALSDYTRIDYFKPKDLILADTTIRQAVTYTEPYEYNGTMYTIDSDEAAFSSVSSSSGLLPGFTAKVGANWNFTERQNVFFNTGYLLKAPPFQNVFSRDNAEYDRIVNEEITAFELGYGYRSGRFSLNVNGYHTQWLNKPYLAAVQVEAGGDFESVNLAGLKALHRGIELDFAHEIIPNKLIWEGLASFGDWTWQTDGAAVAFLSDVGADASALQFSANGVHVGDSPQFQVGGKIRYEPIKKAYVSLRGIYFDRFYSDFEPTQLAIGSGNEDRDTWRIPAYSLWDIHAGYRFKVGNSRCKVNGSVLNLLDTRYISDASTRDGFLANEIEVFFGTGRRFSVGFEVSL